MDEGPAHGYELMKRLEERSGGMYRASAGTVYPVLQQLEHPAYGDTTKFWVQLTADF